VAGSCEHSKKLLGSVKCREFPDLLSDHGLLKKTLLHGVS
jgi:hypothetical protein